MATNTTDVRHMINIEPVSPEQVDNVVLLQAKAYQNRDDAKRLTRYGLVAQDVETVYPNLVDTGPNGIKVVRAMELIPILVAKIQSLERRLADLETHIPG